MEEKPNPYKTPAGNVSRQASARRRVASTALLTLSVVPSLAFVLAVIPIVMPDAPANIKLEAVAWALGSGSLVVTLLWIGFRLRRGPTN
jgi:hypothetical protein